MATDETELPRLEVLYERGLDNGIPVKRITAAEVQEIEPHVRCLAGIRVYSTGITDYRQVAQKYVELIQSQGGDLRLNTRVLQIRDLPNGKVIETIQGTFQGQTLINCAGLYSDRIARLSGTSPHAKIIPFRGEYYELVPEKRHLVNTLIYPVPNPAFPFLGVHFTKTIDGSVHAGPNAVLSLKREGYRKTDVDWGDVLDVITYPAFWKLAIQYADEGLKEMVRSLSKRVFVQSLQRLIPAVQQEDVIPTHAGVRAQALMDTGQLVDDFLIVPDHHALHVCNAPSPAATSSLEIGRVIAHQAPAPTPITIPLKPSA